MQGREVTSRLCLFGLLAAIPGCGFITGAELDERADRDGDGFVAMQFDGDDCDDDDPAINPSAGEVWYDAVDQDCDGRSDNDQDGDGHDDIGHEGDDCDDLDAAVHPGAAEDCALGDQDCDGLDGDEDPDLVSDYTLYVDGDGDEYGDPATETFACDELPGFVTDATDCDDGNATIHPGADEHCDGVDEDCTGGLDNDPIDPVQYFADADGDGYGDAGDAVYDCLPTDGRVVDGTDCDDTDAAVHPDAVEDCGAPADLNCDGSEGDDDNDSDGTIACEDCDDGDSARHPGATERCNGFDDDCDGETDDEDPQILVASQSSFHADADRDTYGAGAVIKACAQPAGTVIDATDCDDADERVHPGRYDRCGDGEDEDCDGTVDDCEAPAADLDTARGLNFQDKLGGALGSLPDSDGDGFDELIIGSPGLGSGAGALYIVRGPLPTDENDVDTVDVATWTGGPGDGVGTAVAGLDADGDGLGDVLAGAPGGDGVFLVRGPSTSGAAWNTASLVITNRTADEGFGVAVAGGDADGDDVDDLLVGAPFADATLNTDRGRALGFASPLVGARTDADALYDIDGAAGDDNFGRAVALWDDDGDGHASVVVGGSESVLGLFRGGVVSIFDGAAGSLAAGDRDVSISAMVSGDDPGTSLAVVGDLDDDGRADLAVGDTARGKLYVFHRVDGDLDIGDASATLTTQSGSAVVASPLGDMDGDGDVDVLVGSPKDNRAYVLDGLEVAGTKTVASTAWLVVTGEGSVNQTGVAVATADLDRDGEPDAVTASSFDTSSTGAVYVLYASELR